MNGVYSARGVYQCVQYTGGLRVLPKISDRSVLLGVLNPDPIQQQERQKLILYLRPKSEKRDSI